MKTSRISRPEVFCKKVILKHFEKFSEKHLQWSLFYQSYSSQGFSSEFCEIFNDTHLENLFYSVQYKNGWLAASDLFGMFTQSIKFYYTLYYMYKEYRCLENVIHQIDSKNEWLLLPASFTAKFGLVFVLTLENAFS